MLRIKVRSVIVVLQLNKTYWKVFLKRACERQHHDIRLI